MKLRQRRDGSGNSRARTSSSCTSIDEAKKKLSGAEAVMKQNVSGHETRIRTLHEREKSLSAELETSRAEVATARTPVSPLALRVYDRMAPRGLPVVVPLKESKCGGCHLKAFQAKSSRPPAEKIPRPNSAICDQCGRILYWEH